MADTAINTVSQGISQPAQPSADQENILGMLWAKAQGGFGGNENQGVMSASLPTLQGYKSMTGKSIGQTPSNSTNATQSGSNSVQMDANGGGASLDGMGY